MELEDQILQDVLQWLTWYSAKSRIQESILETQLAKKDQIEREGDEKQQHIDDIEVVEEKRASFEAQDPLLEVNLGTKKEPRMTKISGLLLEDDQDWLVQLTKKF